VQEAFTAAWTSLPHFEGRSSLRTWLFAVTAHKVRTLQRLRARTALPLPFAVVEEVDPRALDPERSAEGTDLVEALHVALRELPPGARSTWLLREVEGLTYDQIAEVSGTTTSTVRGQLHRARMHLINRMEAWR
jgi:RNA polymerase sigma-70 factor (ECF subfamily)